ncbi:MAG: DNA repair protein RadC [Corallococcus sp.]|nr:DNA repair protein RadC [Corallococcus sp.]
MANPNEGHRHRLRERMRREGLQNFQDHEVLEMLLFQYLPRQDTNKIAHELLRKFGSFANVLDASPEQLMTVKGVSEATACNLSVLKEVWQRYKKSAAETMPLNGMASIIQYMQLIVADHYHEKLVVVYVDNATKFLLREEFTSNNTQQVNVDIKKIVATAMRANAAGVILFHCHVKGVCVPSEQDIGFTEKLYFALASLNIVLLEHIIFNAANDYYSFFKEGDIAAITEKYNKTLK